MAEHATIARLGHGGDGVVEAEGGPLHVPFALPGEVVAIERAGGRGRLLAVERASPDRIEPFCPYFVRCGGCVAQHVGPGLYAGWKRDKVVSALARAGIEARVDPLVDAGGDGRRRVVLHARRIDGAMRVGFMEAHSHSLVAIEHCPIAVPALADAPAAAATLAAILAGTGKPLDIVVASTRSGLDIDLRGSGPVDERTRQRLIARANELDLARLSLHGDILIERRQPTLTVGRATLLPPPGAFLQPTAAGESALAAAVLAGCGSARRVADLFAGTGPFSLRLAEAAEVHAVENDPSMLAALDRAARSTPGLRRVTTEARDLFRRPLLAPELARFDALVLDPPRAGAEAQARQLILSSLERVVMVSCDPGTFARDAAILVGGGFRLEPVLPIDQFKWSAHVEIVGTFLRARAAKRRR